jgi:hypothetical protein
MLLFLGEGIDYRIQDRKKQEKDRSDRKCEFARPATLGDSASVSGMPFIALKHVSQSLTFLYAP